MASEPRRDPVADPLLTPENAAFLLIDYQPVQVNSIASMERQRLVSNIARATKAAVAFGLPVVHSTVNVQTGRNKPTIAVLRKMLEAFPVYDRTSINAWEDVEFRAAVEEPAGASSSSRRYGRRRASPSPRSTRCGKASRSMRWRTRSAARRLTRTSSRCVASNRRARKCSA
jgi:hypothetical protein